MPVRLRLRPVPLGAACPASRRTWMQTDTGPRWSASIPTRRYQDRDNWIWVRDAKKNKLVVGTQCRILYQDAEGSTRHRA